MPITFVVDEVERAAGGRPTRALRELSTDVLALGGDPELEVIDHEGVHPLLAAVHVAFAEHRALVLTPDAVWLTIAQGVAQHVRLNATRLRSRLVRHAGKETIEIVWPGPPPRDTAGLEQMVDAFRDATAERVGAGLSRLLVCDFSTTTRVERIASEVVLLDAFSPYFDFSMACICGIPEVTLLGEPDDYRKIRERIDVITELELDFWRPSLVRIADELVATAEGRPARQFWQGIYKPIEAYGWERITGWIARLFPYVWRGSRLDEKNPLLELPFDFVPAKPEIGFYQGPGITTRDVPATLSRVAIDVKDRTQEPPKRFNLCLEAGLTHVEQDSAGRLIPRAGYRVRETKASIHQVIERIQAEHEATPAAQPCPTLEVRAEIVAVYDRIESATLFAGPRAWRLRALEAESEWSQPAGAIEIHQKHVWLTLVPLFDLPDERILCSAPGGTYACLSAADVKYDPGGRTVEDDVTGLPVASPARYYIDRNPAEIPVVSRCLADLLSRVLDAGPDIALDSRETLADALKQPW